MEITEVRITLPNTGENPKLLAYCTIEFDRCFVVNEVRYVMGNSGRAFVSMPSRKMTDHCRDCDKKNPLDAKFCAHCGACEPHPKLEADEQLHADVALPINAQFRAKLELAVLMAYANVIRANENLSRTNGESRGREHGVSAEQTA